MHPKLSSGDAEERVARVHVQLSPNDAVAGWRSEPFSLGWVVYRVDPDRRRGWGPYFVTHAGDVFFTGSAHPTEAYVKDLEVMMLATWNPLRYLRYLARRIFDGRTPSRVR